MKLFTLYFKASFQLKNIEKRKKMKKDNILKELVGATYNGSQYLIESDTSISRLSNQTSAVSIKDLFKVSHL